MSILHIYCIFREGDNIEGRWLIIYSRDNPLTSMRYSDDIRTLYYIWLEHYHIRFSLFLSGLVSWSSLENPQQSKAPPASPFSNCATSTISRSSVWLVMSRIELVSICQVFQLCIQFLASWKASRGAFGLGVLALPHSPTISINR